MKEKYELGNKEFQIPTEAEKHYDEQELEAAKEMYGAIEYEEGNITPDQYVSKKDISKEAQAKVYAFKQKKIGGGVFSYFRNAA